MIGLAYMNPAVACVVIRMSTYCPHVMEGTGADDIKGLRAWMKRYRDDPRVKILYCRGFDALACVQAETPDHDWSDTIVMIHDDAVKLAAHPDVVLVDAELESRVADDVEQTYRTYRFDINGVLARAQRGFKLADDREPAALPKAIKPAAPQASVQPAAKPAEVKPVTSEIMPVETKKSKAKAETKPVDQDQAPRVKGKPGPKPKVKDANQAPVEAKPKDPAAPVARTTVTPEGLTIKTATRSGRPLASTPAALAARERRARAKAGLPPETKRKPREKPESAKKPANGTPEVKVAPAVAPAPVAPAVVPEAIPEAKIQPAQEPAPAGMLAGLFDGLLAPLADKRRVRVAGWLASRIEGLLDRESWQAAVAKMQSWDMPVDQIIAGLQEVRNSGLLSRLREACPMVLEGTAVPQAAKAANVPVADLMWLHRNWPLVPAAPVEQAQA